MTMPIQPGFFSQVGPQLLKRRWWIMAGIGLVAIIMEVNERIQLHDMVLDFSFFFEAFVEGVAIPILGGVLLSLVDRATQERYQALQLLMRKQALAQAVENAQNWNDLLKIIVEIPRTFVPLVGSVLLIYESGENQFVPGAFWGNHEINPQTITPYRASNLCAACVFNRNSDPCKLRHCDQDLDKINETVRYCLPLVRSGQVMALLHLFQPAGASFTGEHKNLLENLAVDMAAAIDDAQTKRLNTIQKERADAELRRITRDLHDNLAQNLIYVRHKLDQLTGETTLAEITDLQTDLTRLRDVVDDAYMVVRNVLKELEANVSADLFMMLQEYARAIQDRNRFRLKFTCTGQPRPIPTRTARQVLAIFGEILVNIEKHAGADQADVTLAWETETLTLSVTDNGHGFASVSWDGSNGNGHMGLAIMRDRAKEIQGKLTINSTIGKGTEVCLRMPVMNNSKIHAFEMGAIK